MQLKILFNEKISLVKMNSPTHVFKLPSGVECEVKEFTGEHQELLTAQGVNRVGQLDKVLADVLVRVGSVQGSGINAEFAAQMLTADRNWIMFQVRQFSMDFPKEFHLPVKWKTTEGVRMETAIPMQLSDVTFKPYPFQANEYSEIVRDYTLNIKRIEEKVRVTLSDGRAEKRLSALGKKDTSSSTDLFCSNPVYFKKSEKGNETPISLNLKKLGMLAIEDLRAQVLALEGKVYADYEEQHPDENRTGEERVIRGNLLGNVNFLFPSGVYS
jgi:hypothetical protein